MENVIEISENASFIYVPNAINGNEKDLNELYNLLNQKEKLKFKLYGKECTMHRKQALFGPISYKFSGKTILPEDKMNPLVEKCLNYSNKKYNLNFNTALCNLYQDGKDYISPHRDNESQHDKGTPILTFSFGETRTMVITSISGQELFKQKIVLDHGSCGIMFGREFQEKYKHGIPKDKSKKWRISITVRKF